MEENDREWNGRGEATAQRAKEQRQSGANATSEGRACTHTHLVVGTILELNADNGGNADVVLVLRRQLAIVDSERLY